LLVAALAACYVPLGNWIAKIFTSSHHWKVERGVYKVIGINPEADQKWSAYLRSMLAFSGVSVLVLYGLQRLQHYLLQFVGPHMAPVPPATAFNTAVSFVTNTNWQNYSGESTMTYLVQMGGLAVQNFMSAAVGIVIAIALIRGFTRSRTDKLGNFWVDVTRCVFRLLLPLSVIGAIVFMAGGAIDNFATYHTLTTLSGSHQTMVGGPVASQEIIKDMGNNGGGFFNANSAHPFENPGSVSNVVEIILMLLLPSALPRAFGRMVGDRRQGWALAAVVTVLANIMLGEVSPGGVGSGLYGLVIAALLAVFLGGLMVGRTPEYLGKRIGPSEIKLVSLYLLTPHRGPRRHRASALPPGRTQRYR
jgi:K+-transporting ATPase ATPase A chain